jgi:regulator of sigma E protease
MFDISAASNPLLVIAAFVIVLIPAVIIHELGHFIAAKLVGISILEFGIGMPPRMVRLGRWRGTDITLNWLPLGGFVRPLGEDMVRQLGDDAITTDRDEAAARGIEKPMSVGEARPLGRILFMAGGALANFLSALLIFIIIGLTGLPQAVGARYQIVYVAQDSPAAAIGLQPGDVVESVNGELIADETALLEAVRSSAADGFTVSILRDESAQTLSVEAGTIDPDVLSAWETHPLISGIADMSPAALAGIMPGDLVIALNGESIMNFEALQAATRANLEQEVTLTLLREGEEVTVSLVPRANPPQGEGSMGIGINDGAVSRGLGTAILPVTPVQELVPLSLGASVQYGIDRVVGVVRQIIEVPVQLVSALINRQPVGEEMRVTSVLGISQVGGVLLQESIEQRQPTIILEYIALLSLALGITNLLPIPALDGGRILFVLIEILRGRPMAPEREGMVHLVGLALLLSLMVVVVINDIANPIVNILR